MRYRLRIPTDKNIKGELNKMAWEIVDKASSPRKRKDEKPKDKFDASMSYQRRRWSNRGLVKR